MSTMKPDYVIFPDGSERRTGKEKYAGYGVVVLNTRTGQYTTDSNELYGRSVPYCEGYAVYRGFQHIEQIRKPNESLSVLILSDNKTTVNSLQIWVRKSWDLSDYRNWKRCDGSPVHHQELYRKILTILCNGHYRAKFVHIRSHAEGDAKLREIIKQKLKIHKVKADDSTLDVFIRMNQLADNLAREASGYLKDTIGLLDRLKPKGDLI